MARRSCRTARSKVVKMKMSRRNLTKLTGAAAIGLPAGFTQECHSRPAADAHPHEHGAVASFRFGLWPGL